MKHPFVMTKPRPFGHYFILEKIAQGGMAEIFKGLTYDFSGLKKFIVIKRILPHIAANKEFIRMLVDEAKIAVRLSHGNIAQTFDLGRVADDYFIVMEYVEGRTLSHIFKKSTAKHLPIPIPFAAYAIGEVANALDYMHRKRDEQGKLLQIVHRDISPQNVIVTYSGNVKIVDFGVAIAASKLSEAESGVIKGKFAYMSPEQTEGTYIDHRSDIFSAGVILWELLTGRRLFKKKSNPETIKAVLQSEIYPPSAFRPEVPPELDEIVSKALSREMDRRYGNAAEMSLDITKFMLKYYPDFKPGQISDFLNHIFEDEEQTYTLHQEKTMREELTLKFRNQEEIPEKPGPSEDTMIVDPQELDFRSIFDDFDLEESSELTYAVPVEKDQGEGGKRVMQGSLDSKPGDKTQDLSSGFQQETKKSPIKKIALISVFLISILMLIFFYWLFHVKLEKQKASFLQHGSASTKPYPEGKRL